MKNILVNGGAGFIGSHLVKYHLDKGSSVWAIDNLSSGSLSNIEPVLSHKNMRFTQGDLCSCPELQEAVEWSDRIYHMAAVVGQYNVVTYPVETLSTNITTCERVLALMAQTKKKTRLLLPSSSGVYLHSPIPQGGANIEEEMLSLPSGHFIQESYCLSKIVNEVMSLSYVHEKKIHCTIARLFNTIGVHQTGRYGMVVPRLIDQALKGEPLTIYGTGLQTRSFFNVHDTVVGLELLLENPESIGQIYNLGSEEECSILDLAHRILKKTNSSSKIQYVPYKEAYGIDFIDVEKRRPDLKKMRALTGFNASWTLDQTLDEIIASKRDKRESA
ncbi:MAG: NAD-dependent epimerase/dehydratase family protein [Chlamydiae bacterium]|nr:NAD-dependent epimerase/dehydratase family protein [Chlamydiota bacterium]